MSEPVTTWQPLIDFDEAGQRVSEIETAFTKDVAARAERLRLVRGLVRGKDDSAMENVNKAVLIDIPREVTAGASSIDPPPVAASPEPVFRGDFAEIEAALLRTALLSVAPSKSPDAPQSQSRFPQALRASREEPAAHAVSSYAALSSEAPDSPGQRDSLLSAVRDTAFFPESSALSESFMLFDDAAVSGSAAMVDEDKRSRRPLYIMAALVFAGVAGIAATSFKRDDAVEVSQDAMRIPAIAPLAAENGAAPATQDAAAGGSAPAQLASAAQDAPQAADSAPLAPANPANAAPHVVSFSEPAQSAEPPAPLPGVAATANADSSILATPPVAKTPALASIGEAKKVKTATVRPDGSLIKAEAPVKTAAPKVALHKDIPAKTQAVKDPSSKAASKVAHLTQPHPGASTPTGAKTANGAAKPAATAAKAKPTAPQDAPVAQTAPAAEPQPAAPAPKPTGPLAFVDTAVNSITGATGKLLDWGRTASGAH
jgi:hypothetical protein